MTAEIKTPIIPYENNSSYAMYHEVLYYCRRTSSCSRRGALGEPINWHGYRVDESEFRVRIFKNIGGIYVDGRRVDVMYIDDVYSASDFVFEATGIAKLQIQLIDTLSNGVYFATGIPPGSRPMTILAGDIMQLTDFREALQKPGKNEIKTVIDWQQQNLLKDFTMNTNDPRNAISNFESMASERLNNHLMELNTRYGGELPESKDLLRQGYEAHRRIFETELEQEKQKIAGSDNPWLAGEIDRLKQDFLHRLRPDSRSSL